MNQFLKTGLFIVVLIQLLYFPDKGWTEPIPVFVSILPQKYFVERVGKEQVKVEVMVNPGESPATFNPNPKKMRIGHLNLRKKNRRNIRKKRNLKKRSRLRKKSM